MKEQTFEKFMEDIHYKVFPEVLDDDIPDHFDNWLGTIEVEDMMKWAEIYGKEQFLSGQDHALKTIFEK